MKVAFTSIILMVLLFAGCKKDNSNKKATPYLLKSIAYSNGTTTTFDYFRYDDQSRVVEFDDNQRHFIYKYYYDNIGNVISAETFDATRNIMIELDRFTYSGNTVTAGRVSADNSTTTIYTFTLDDKKQAVKILLADGEYILNTFDSKGDVSNTSFYVSSGQVENSIDFTYDNKWNPMTTMNGVNLHLVYLLGAPAFSTNNILTDPGLPATYTYLYFDDGLPSSASTPAQNNGISTITYDYFSK
ncbi:MAG: hypothetical protein ACXVB0_18070 [Mucilaginibacter sp.]